MIVKKTFLDTKASLVAAGSRGDGSPTKYDNGLASIFYKTYKNSPYGSWSIPDTVTTKSSGSCCSGSSCWSSICNTCSDWCGKIVGSFSAQGADFSQGWANFNEVSSNDLFGGLWKMGVANLLQSVMANPWGALKSVFSGLGSLLS